MNNDLQDRVERIEEEIGIVEDEEPEWPGVLPSMFAPYENVLESTQDDSEITFWKDSQGDCWIVTDDNHFCMFDTEMREIGEAFTGDSK